MLLTQWRLPWFAFAATLVFFIAAQSVIGLDNPESKFITEVRAANYEQMPPPPEPVRVRWNFADGTAYTYTLHQTSETISNFPDGDTGEPIRSTTKGKFEIKAEGDREAKIVLSDLGIAVNKDGVGGDDVDSTFRSQSMVVRGLQEDGTIPTAGSQQNALLQLLFPLPDRPLAEGETSTTPFHFPVNVFGSPLMAEGEVEMTFTGLVYVRGKNCAQVDFLVGVGELEVPEEIQTKFDFALSGAGRYFFDVDAGRLVESNVAVLMAMDAEFPSEFMQMGEQDKDAPVFETISMSNDVLIQLTSD